MASAVVTVGGAPPPSWGLPQAGSLGAIGNAQSQLGQAQALLNTASKATGGDTAAIQSILGAGVTLLPAGSTASGVARTLLTGSQLAGAFAGVAGALASGAALGGPIGAAVGAAAGLVSAVQTLFSGYQGLKMSPSQAAQEMYEKRAAWQVANVGFASNEPAGWTLCDYLAVKYPPSTTTRQSDLWNARAQTLTEVWATSQALGISVSTPDKFVLLDKAKSAADLVAWFQAGALPYAGVSSDGQSIVYGMPGNPFTAKEFASEVRPLCTPVFFNWGNPSSIQDCLLNELQTYLPLAQLSLLWKDDIIPLTSNGQSLSKDTIAARAYARRPDPLYFAADLYVFQNGWGSPETILVNCEALTMMSTILGMLEVGASTRAILSELLLQQSLIATNSSDGQTVPFLCRMLVEDYLALAAGEIAQAKAILKKNATTLIHSTPSTKIAPTSAAQAQALRQSQAAGGSSVSSGTVVLGVGAAALAAGAGYKYLLPRLL